MSLELVILCIVRYKMNIKNWVHYLFSPTPTNKPISIVCFYAEPNYKIQYIFAVFN